MKLNGKWYEALKWIAVIFLPALEIFIKSVFPIWNIPYGNQIADTLIALHIFIGAVIGISTINYNKDLKSKM